MNPDKPEASEPSAKRRFAEAQCWTSLVESLKAWRKAEKRHALMVLGELGGDMDEAKNTADRKLNAVRIEADKIEAMSNSVINNPVAKTKTQMRCTKKHSQADVVDKPETKPT